MGVSNFDTVKADAVVTDAMTAGAVEADAVEADEVKVGDAKLYPVLIGDAAPTTATVGAVGQFYVDKTNKMLWICTAATTTYTWLGVAIA